MHLALAARNLTTTALLMGSVIFATSFAADISVSAATLKTLHTFVNCNSDSCTDGTAPISNLTADSSGNLFGTTYQGGANGQGTVFKLSPDGNGGYSYQTVYSFCSEEDCADGGNPQAALIIDNSGNLYGTTQSGGEDDGGGTAFKLTPGGNKRASHLVVIHNYCGADAPTPEDDCMGGSTPTGGLTYAGETSGATYDGISPLFGASIEGGEGEAGILYSLKPANPKKEEWKISEIYVFCAPGGPVKRKGHSREDDPNCDDGKFPSGALIADSAGNLFGTTTEGGEDANIENGGGVVFELSPGPHRSWTETVLHKFCLKTECTDGKNPYGQLAFAGDGGLLGVTLRGGKSCGSQDPCGVAYKVSPNGAASKFSALYSFCSKANCKDGAAPEGPISLSSDGVIFGATLIGGKRDGGTLFSLSGKSLATLYSFCSAVKCSDGQFPTGAIADGSGNLFGVTTSGGTNGGGTVFELMP